MVKLQAQMDENELLGFESKRFGQTFQNCDKDFGPGTNNLGNL